MGGGGRTAVPPSVVVSSMSRKPEPTLFDKKNGDKGEPDPVDPKADEAPGGPDDLKLFGKKKAPDGKKTTVA